MAESLELKHGELQQGELSESQAEVAELTIVYQDEHIVVIDKPAGLLVHRSRIDRYETRFAMQMLRDQIGQHVFPVHRLDKPTSGLLLFALDSDTARLLTAQFTAGMIEKTYLAVVRGVPDESGVIDYSLKEELDAASDRLARQDKPAQEAITHYQRLATIELPFAVSRYPTTRYSLVKLQPKTGRKHQLRRHMHHVFHPIIGDTTHGEGRHNRFFRQQYDCSRLLLAATELRFAHPITGESLSLHVPPSGDFAQVLESFGWSLAD